MLVKPLKVLIACEFTGTVRDAFLARGHDAWSCDLLPSLKPTNRHIRADVRTVLNDGWDLLCVMHPPCTRLCNSGVRWLSEPPGKISAEHYTRAEVDAYTRMSRDERHAFMWRKLDEGAALFSDCWNAPIERKAIENPVMHAHAKERIRNYREFAQSIQPHEFGTPEFKRTCLWLDNLPPLMPTDRLTPPKPGTAEHKAWSRVHNAPPGPARWAERSKFFPKVADAMAEQWGGWACEQEEARLAA